MFNIFCSHLIELLSGRGEGYEAMLKFSNRGIYGMKALYELARHYGSEPLNIRVISKRHDLPVPFLEQVLHRLKTRGLVTSKRGVNGGYLLSRDPREITIGDAIRALEGPIALCDCLQHIHSSQSSKKMQSCVTSRVYQKLSHQVEDVFDSVTLFELASEPWTEFKGTCSRKHPNGNTQNG